MYQAHNQYHHLVQHHLHHIRQLLPIQYRQYKQRMESPVQLLAVIQLPILCQDIPMYHHQQQDILASLLLLMECLLLVILVCGVLLLDIRHMGLDTHMDPLLDIQLAINRIQPHRLQGQQHTRIHQHHRHHHHPK